MLSLLKKFMIHIPLFSRVAGSNLVFASRNCRDRPKLPLPSLSRTCCIIILPPNRGIIQLLEGDNSVYRVTNLSRDQTATGRGRPYITIYLYCYKLENFTLMTMTFVATK